MMNSQSTMSWLGDSTPDRFVCMKKGREVYYASKICKIGMRVFQVNKCT